MRYRHSETANSAIRLIFNTTGVKGITSLREIVKKKALFCSGGDRYHEPPGVYEDGPYLSYSTKCFIQGWEAAGGADALWITWHIVSGTYCFLLWKQDPTDLLEEVIRENRPDLLVRDVQTS